ncbi:MAG TPA: hypothetical protein VKJ77_19975 [Caballeronia sp.]|nr:hypothetical protein [Caballeronia sp.]
MPQKDDVGLAVRFRNDSDVALRSIMWRAKYGKGTVDFIDDGIFTHDVRIDNRVLAEQGSSHFDWGGLALDALFVAARALPGASLTTTNLVLPPYVSTSDPENCSIVRATYENGETWRNPQVAQDPSPFLTPRSPIPVPSAMLGQAQTQTPEPMQFTHCTLLFAFKQQLDVTFRSVGSRAADRIVVRTAYGKGAIDFVDEGTFAPDTVFKHRLTKPLTDETRGISYWSLDDPRDCAVVSAHFTDGSTWQNPSIEAAPGPLPTRVPDVMRWRSGDWAPRHNVPAPSPMPSVSPTTAS